MLPEGKQNVQYWQHSFRQRSLTCSVSSGSAHHHTLLHVHDKHSVRQCWCLWCCRSTTNKREEKGNFHTRGQPLSTPSREREVVSVSHPACDSGVSLRLGYEVSQQGAGAQEAQANVGGLREVSQHRRVCEVFGAWSAVDQRHHNLDETFI